MQHDESVHSEMDHKGTDEQSDDFRSIGDTNWSTRLNPVLGWGLLKGILGSGCR